VNARPALDAEIAARRAVEAALASIYAGRDEHFDIQRINGGFTNYNWKVASEGGETYFVKVPGKSTSMFIDRVTARDASIKVGLLGCAARLLHVFEENGIEIYEFLDGFRSATITDMFDGENVASVVDKYRVVHSSQHFLTLKTGFDQIREHLQQLQENRLLIPGPVESLLAPAAEAEAAIMASGMDLCGCYNDGHITNYMIASRGDVRIIDWEYSAENDRYWDIALFGLEIFLDGDRLNAVIEQYCGSYRSDVAARIYLYCALGCLKWGLWAALQSQLSTLNFDFRKYCEFLLMRDKRAMDSDAWAKALRDV
jgi:thiamine kinase-like enzyme